MKRRRLSRRQPMRRGAGLRPTYRGWNVRSLNRRAGPEWKYRDTSIGTDTGYITQDASHEAFHPIIALSQGAGPTQRLGEQVSVRSIQMNVAFECSATTADLVRIMLVLDRQPNSTLALISDVLSTSGATTINCQSQRKLENRKRFKILLDKRIPTSVSNYTPYVTRKYYLKFKKPVLVQYNTANAGDYTDITSNSLLMCCFGDSASTAEQPYLIAQIRCRFTD